MTIHNSSVAAISCSVWLKSMSINGHPKILPNVDDVDRVGQFYGLVVRLCFLPFDKTEKLSCIGLHGLHGSHSEVSTMNESLRKGQQSLLKIIAT